MDRKRTKSIRVGPIGPIPIVDANDPRRLAGIAASQIAQSAIECDDLLALVTAHPDPLVRMEAVPRLKARFPLVDTAHSALLKAVSDVDDGVRCAAISAVADLRLAEAADLLVVALKDQEPDVRFFAAIGLKTLDDERAPADPEAFAYRTS